MKISFRKFVAHAVFMALACNAQAATLVCSGTVEELSYHQPGHLFVRLSGMNIGALFCNTDGEWVVPGSVGGNTTVSACKTLYATFLAAKMNKTPINNMYMDADVLPANCNSFTSFTHVNIRYFSL